MLILLTIHTWISSLALTSAPEGSRTRNYQKRPGPGVPEPPEGLWSRGSRCCRQQSQRSANWQAVNEAETNTCALFFQSEPRWRSTACLFLTVSPFPLWSEFCENLPEDSREQIIMTHILPCVKVKSFLSCLPHQLLLKRQLLWYSRMGRSSDRCSSVFL